MITKSELKLVGINALYNFASVLSTSFVSVFIYAYTESLVMMSIYTIIRIGLFPFFFTIAGKAVRRVSYSFIIAGGLILLTIMLIYVIFAEALFKENSAYVLVAAIFYGMGEGLYWFSTNNSNQIVPLAEHRASYLANVGIFNNITNIIAPLISSFILSFVANELSGYYIIFGIIISLYILVIVISLTLTIENKETRNFSVLKCLRVKGDNNWKMVMYSTFLYGFRESLTLTLTNILIYNATGGSDSLYSNLLMVFSIAGIVSYYILKDKMNEKTLFSFFKIGLIFIVTSTLALVYFENVFGAIYFGFANAIGSALYGNPHSFCMINAMSRYPNENVAGRVIAKETAMSFGRCLGMSIIVLCYYIFGKANYMIIAVSLLSLTPILVVYIVRKYYRVESL